MSLHYHSCPECYEHKPCEMACTIEPDLEDTTYSPVREFGAHCICNECKGSLLTKEWFLKYNGFKR